MSVSERLYGKHIASLEEYMEIINMREGNVHGKSIDKLKKAIEQLSISQKSEFKPEPGEKPDENGDYWRTINGHKVRFRRGDIVEDNVREQVPKDRLGSGKKPTYKTTYAEARASWNETNVVKARSKYYDTPESIREMEKAYNKDWQATDTIYRGVDVMDYTADTKSINRKVVESMLKRRSVAPNKNADSPAAVSASQHVAVKYGVLVFAIPKSGIDARHPSDLLYDSEEAGDINNRYLDLLEKRVKPDTVLPDSTTIIITDEHGKEFQRKLVKMAKEIITENNLQFDVVTMK